MWTRSQRIVLLGLLVCLLVYLSIRFALNHHALTNAPPVVGPMADQLASHLDPNTASRGALSEIPGVGQTLAQAIIDYREQFQKSHPGQPAFTRPEDMRRVRGIGVAREESLQEFLQFPALPSTRSSNNK